MVTGILKKMFGGGCQRMAWHGLWVGLTLVWLAGGAGWAQSPAGESSAGTSSSPLPGGLRFPGEGERIPIPVEALGDYGIPYVRPRHGPPLIPEAYITRRNGQLIAQWRERFENGELSSLVREFPLTVNIERVYPPHRQIEFPGHTRFHRGTWASGYETQSEPDSHPDSPARYWLPEDGLFSSGQRIINDAREGKIYALYDRETAPCLTYIRFRREAIERAVNQYVNTVQLLSGRSVSADGKIPTVSDVERGVVVPRGLMEEVAAARCRCRAYLDLYTESVTGMRRTSPINDNGAIASILRRVHGPGQVAMMAGSGGNMPITRATLDLAYDALDRLSEGLPKDINGQVLLVGPRAAEGSHLVTITLPLMYLAREFAMESARLHSCNVLGPEALERELFNIGETAFGDCELAQVAAIQMRHHAAANPAALAANELRQLFPNDFRMLVSQRRDGEQELMRQGGNTGTGLQHDRLREVATALSDLCEQSKAMQNSPAGEQIRACRQLSQGQREMDQMQMTHRNLALRQMRLQEFLSGDAAVRQQLQIETQRLFLQEQQREKQAELERLSRLCNGGTPPVAYAAGMAAMETGPCRDLEAAAKALDDATRRRNELQQSLEGFFAGAAQRAGNLSAAAQEGVQMQRQLHQAVQEAVRWQQQLQELEAACQSRVRQVATSPNVLATLRHANPYQPALPNACEDAIESLRQLQEDLARRYRSHVDIEMLKRQNNPALADAKQRITQLSENVAAACQNSPDPLQRKFACETRVALHLRTQATINNVLSWIETRWRERFAGRITHPFFDRLSDEERRRLAIEAPVDPVISDELRFLQRRGLLSGVTIPTSGTIHLADIRNQLVTLSRSQHMQNVERCE